MTELQNYINNYGLRTSLKELVSRAYWEMKAKGHEACVINDRYIEVDGKTYYFSRSKKAGHWVLKEIVRR